MAILKVARLGHPVLRQKALPVPVGDILSSETQRLIDDLVETMREYNGAGLAAPQVHVLKQICVIEVNDNPNIDAGVEDKVLKGELYRRIMEVFLRRIERRKAGFEGP